MFRGMEQMMLFGPSGPSMDMPDEPVGAAPAGPDHEPGPVAVPPGKGPPPQLPPGPRSQGGPPRLGLPDDPPPAVRSNYSVR
jgi:hypothetical protein